jgi:hypothetical protein
MAVVVAWLVAVAIVGFAMRFVGRPETPPSST